MSSPDVTNSTPVNRPLCIHESHLFNHPLCEDQTVLARVANVAFHVFTLGIPLLVYKIVRVLYSCFSKTEANPGSEGLPAMAIASVQGDKALKPYSPLAQEALNFARQKLAEINPEPISYRKEPANDEIPKLACLYSDAFKKFSGAVEANKGNPWASQDVITATDEFMKFAFAVSALTLEDLDAFANSLPENDQKKTRVALLARQDSYQYRTFYFCTNVYHFARGAIGWSVHPWAKEDGEQLNYPRGDVPVEHATLFYQEGTMQNQWNKLYNEYCKRVRMYVTEDELRSRNGDGRHANWTKKDTGISSFSRQPDTQPS